MKKLLIITILLIATSFLFGVDWNYQNLYFTDDGSYTATMEVNETDTTSTYNMGIIKTLPTEVTFTHKIIPTAKTGGNGIAVYVALYCSNDATIWYSYGNIDTITVDSTEQANGTTVIDDVTISDVPNYRYFRLFLTNSATVDTCTVKMQKSAIY